MRGADRLALFLAGALLAGCSLAPPYRAPAVPVAPAYQDAGLWRPAAPADRQPRGAWWADYRDATLDRLQAQLLAQNADLAAALAHYRQAQALERADRSARWPEVTGSAGVTRQRQSDTRPLRGTGAQPSIYDNDIVGIAADYEVDLWGRVRDTVAAGRADTQAAAADLASAQLSLQAELADGYIALRGLDQQSALLAQSIDAYGKALELTRARHAGGIASGLDVARAQTQLASARSLAAQTLAARALEQHAIAVLVGASADAFTLPPATARLTLPAVPPGVPSALLERRPDVAAAERRTAAANARVGVARAAFFPELTLGAQAGFQSAQYAGLLAAPNRIWALGPALVATLFDGGRRRAGVALAHAASDEAGAHYRSVVLHAFAQVEDSLAILGHVGRALTDQAEAAAAAQRSLDLALDRYKQGAVGYLDVVTAQTAALDARRSLLDLDTRQLRASVALTRALGGGWSASAQPAPTTR